MPMPGIYTQPFTCSPYWAAFVSSYDISGFIVGDGRSVGVGEGDAVGDGEGVAVGVASIICISS